MVSILVTLNESSHFGNAMNKLNKAMSKLTESQTEASKLY